MVNFVNSLFPSGRHQRFRKARSPIAPQKDSIAVNVLLFQFDDEVKFPILL